MKVEYIQALLEREGINEYILTEDYIDVPGTEIGLFKLSNNRWGAGFKIYPPYYGGKATESKFHTFYKLALPSDSSVQVFSMASRNIDNYIDAYKDVHSTPANVKNHEILRKFIEERASWMKRHATDPLFEDKGVDFRLRNFVNLCLITIPEKNEFGAKRSKSEIVSMLTKVYTGLTDFYPRKLTKDEFIVIMSEILDPDQDNWYSTEDNRTTINNQISSPNSILVLPDEHYPTISIGNEISDEEYYELNPPDNKERPKRGLLSFWKKNKDEESFKKTKWHATVLTTKQYPRTINMQEMLESFVDFYGIQTEPEIPANFFASLQIYYPDRIDMKKSVQLKTQWTLQQTESMDLVRFFPSLRERSVEAEEINIALSNNEIPVRAMWSLVIMEKSKKKLTRYTERIVKNFEEKSWKLQQEDELRQIIFMKSLPLQFEPFSMDFSARLNTLFVKNTAAITPIMTGERGSGQPVIPLINRVGQVASLDLFSKDNVNYNFIAIGDSGSGKSYFVSFLFQNYLANGAKIRVFDVGKSYQDFCNLVGGQVISFSENICLNFFTDIKINDEGQIHEEEFYTIVPLIGLMAMQSLSIEDIGSMGLDTPVISGHISKAVADAFESKGRNAGMEDVLNALKKESVNIKNETGEKDLILSKLIVSLFSFGDPEGAHYSLFNGRKNVSFDSDFVIIELEEIEANQHLKSVVLAAMSHTIHTEFFLSSREQKKLLVVDEAWSLMDNKVVVRFLETMARRIRKHNGSLGVITQNFADFSKNSATKAIYDASATKLFLKQSDDSIEAAKNAGSLTLSDTMIGLLGTVKKKSGMFSEILVKKDSGSFFIGLVIVDKISHWLNTNDPEDMRQVMEISKEFGVNTLDAKIIIGYSEEYNISKNEAYRKRLKEGFLINKEVK